MKIDPNAPAYPQPCAADNATGIYTSAEKHPDNAGMTIRAAMATQALQGLLSEKGDEPHNWTSYEAWAGHAVALADALIAALNAD